MDKLLRRMEQDKKRNKDEFEKMKRHVYVMSYVGIGFLILISTVCAVIFTGGAVLLCD